MHSLETEIQERLRKRYLDRLADRVKRMRKLLAERAWEELRSDCHQIKGSGGSFGFQILTELATRAEDLIPPGTIQKSRALPDARQAVELLIAAMDELVTENSISHI